MSKKKAKGTQDIPEPKGDGDTGNPKAGQEPEGEEKLTQGSDNIKAGGDDDPYKDLDPEDVISGAWTPPTGDEDGTDGDMKQAGDGDAGEGKGEGDEKTPPGDEGDEDAGKYLFTPKVDGQTITLDPEEDRDKITELLQFGIKAKGNLGKYSNISKLFNDFPWLQSKVSEFIHRELTGQSKAGSQGDIGTAGIKGDQEEALSEEDNYILDIVKKDPDFRRVVDMARGMEQTSAANKVLDHYASEDDRFADVIYPAMRSFASGLGAGYAKLVDSDLDAFDQCYRTVRGILEKQGALTGTQPAEKLPGHTEKKKPPIVSQQENFRLRPGQSEEGGPKKDGYGDIFELSEKEYDKLLQDALAR